MIAVLPQTKVSKGAICSTCDNDSCKHTPQYHEYGYIAILSHFQPHLLIFLLSFSAPPLPHHPKSLVGIQIAKHTSCSTCYIMTAIPHSTVLIIILSHFIRFPHTFFPTLVPFYVVHLQTRPSFLD